MRVQSLRDWEGASPPSFKKKQITELDDDLAWVLATQGYVKFLKTPDPVIEQAKAEAKEARRANKL